MKSKLIQEVGKNQDPDEAGLESFLQVIRDHEAMVKAREYKEDSGRNMNRVQSDGVQSGAQSNPHRVCGKVHGRGECKYQCSECKKPHKEEDCYELHPEKRTKTWVTPPKKKGKVKEVTEIGRKGMTEKEAEVKVWRREEKNQRTKDLSLHIRPEQGLIESLQIVKMRKNEIKGK